MMDFGFSAAEAIQTIETEESRFYRDKTASSSSGYNSQITNGEWTFIPKSRKFYLISKNI